MSEQEINPKDIELDNVEEVVESETTATDSDENIARIVELEAALAASEATVSGQRDAVLRAKASEENVRRRATLDVEKAHKFALNKFANELLPVVDNLERAIGAADQENEATKSLVEGIEMTLNSFTEALAKSGINQVNPKGEVFNPELHQAMTMIEVPGAEPNTVIDVMQKGYEMNGRLLRPAMVVVAKGNSVDTNA